MPISLRALFGRPGVASDEISIRNALRNHPVSTRRLRAVAAALSAPDRGDGFQAGCREAGSSTIDIPGVLHREVGQVLPAWVDVRPNDRGARTLEGVLRKAKMTDEDFPLKPWHSSLDWNFFVHADPQYAYLVSKPSMDHNSVKFGETSQPIIECEWESALIPLWAVPQEDCRIWLVGRWICDCGHPEDGHHRTEIHPPKAIASFRREAAALPGNPAPTPVTRAVLYIGRLGGYINQQIRQTYTFDLHLPPKPHVAAEPRFTIVPMTGALPVLPTVTPFPERRPKLLRVTVPLSGVTGIDEYGAIICGGWSDPDGAAASRVQRVRVTIERITRTRTEATEKPEQEPQSGAGFRTWHLHIGINGRWHQVNLDSAKNSVNVSVDLMLSSNDRIQLSAFGIEKRNIFGYLGTETGLASAFASERQPHEKREVALTRIAKAFRDGIVKHGPPLSDGNVSLGIFSRSHRSNQRGSFTDDSSSFPGTFTNKQKHNNYVIEYRIDSN